MEYIRYIYIFKNAKNKKMNLRTKCMPTNNSIGKIPTNNLKKSKSPECPYFWIYNNDA
jgi:hypothetical protein